MADWWRLLLEDYFAWCARRGLSPNTVRTWKYPLLSFGRSLEGLVDAADQLRKEHIAAWQDQVRKVREDNGQIVAATALRGFLRWLELEAELEVRPGLWYRVQVPRRHEGLPRPIDEPDLKRLLGYLAKPTRDLEFLRDRAYVLVAITSGARVSELLQMRVDHVAGTRPAIVRQKGGREKVLVWSPTSREWCLQYLRVRGPDQQPALWIRVGPGSARQPIGYEGIRTMIRRRCELAGVPYFNPHRTRHTAGTQLLELGFADTEIASVLGHSNTQYVRLYAKVKAERRQAMVDQLDHVLGVDGANAAILPLRRRRRRR